MRAFLYILGGSLFVLAFVGHVFVRIRLRADDDLDDCYHEFEEEHRGYAHYLRWHKITLAMGCAGLLFMFLAVAV
jgi:hypothetical protein